MGWDGIRYNEVLSSTKKAVDFFRNHEGMKSIIEAHLHRTGNGQDELYCVCQLPDNKGLIAAVILIRYEIHDGDNYLYYKAMDESVEPFYYNMPLALLNKLTIYPEINISAKAWRIKAYMIHNKEMIPKHYHAWLPEVAKYCEENKAA